MKNLPPDSAEQWLRQLEWVVLRRLDGLLLGDYRTLLRGAGMDLADLRGYQYHDDVRHIDWNVTARLQAPHVRVFTEDREMSAWFLLDLSASMDVGSGERCKRQVAADFVAVLARLLTRHGNRVGALLYGTGLEAVIPARASRLHALQLLHRLQSRAPASGPDSSGPTRLHELLEAAERLLRQRCTVFVLSDFISAPGWVPWLMRMSLAITGMATRLSVGMSKKPWIWPAWRSMVSTRWAPGVDALELSTDDDLAQAIVRFTQLRQRRSQTLPKGLS